MNMICLEVTEGELSIFMILSDFARIPSVQDCEVPKPRWLSSSFVCLSVLSLVSSPKSRIPHSYVQEI